MKKLKPETIDNILRIAFLICGILGAITFAVYWLYLVAVFAPPVV